MKNEALAALEPLIGEWEYTMYNCWFLESMEAEMKGATRIERLHDAFVVVRNEQAGKKPGDVWVIGYSDVQEKYELFYYDQRGVSRIFDMSFDGKSWSFSREDKDFYQRFVVRIMPDEMHATTEVSEDKGMTWRKDFDMTYARKVRS